MNAQLRPLYDLIAVELQEQPDTIRGLHMPERAKQNRDARAGRVLAVGPGRLSESGSFQEVTVKPGDVVLFSKSAGVSVDPEDRVRLIRCCELIATLEEQRVVVP